jgi:hypothetical protein
MDFDTVMTYLQIFAWFYVIGWAITFSAAVWGIVYLVKRFLWRNTDDLV